jgi:hypothetical protein
VNYGDNGDNQTNFRDSVFTLPRCQSIFPRESRRFEADGYDVGKFPEKGADGVYNGDHVFSLLGMPRRPQHHGLRVPYDIPLEEPLKPRRDGIDVFLTYSVGVKNRGEIQNVLNHEFLLKEDFLGTRKLCELRDDLPVRHGIGQ